MNLQMNRRSFLKVLSLLSLTSLLDNQAPLGQTDNSIQNPEMPNVLILVFDALAAQHMSLYGYRRETTPNLARFAEKATIYHAHYAGGNFTTPGVASIFTGTYPWTHRAFNLRATIAENRKHQNLFRGFGNGIYNRMAYTHNWFANLLLYQLRKDLDVHIKPGEFALADIGFLEQMFPNDADIACRAEYFSLHYRPQVAFSGSFLLFSARAKWRGRTKGTLDEDYATLFPRGISEVENLFFTLERAIDGITTQLGDSRQPFLGYFHFFPPHAPYKPRHEFVDMFDDGWTPVAKRPSFFSEGHSDEHLSQKRREYDEFVAYADAEFGRLYDFMVQSGLLDNTYVVFTSDHGEMFERGILAHHTQVLYEPLIRIPLMIARPGQRYREDIYVPTSCTDVLPTLFHITGQAIPTWCEGEVLPSFGDSETGTDRGIFAVEAKSNSKFAPLTKATVALIKGRYKLIHYFGYDGYENEYELYDLANDPEEMEDLYSTAGPVAADLESELQEKLQEVNRPYLQG